jgi:hypothetical protein
VADVGLRCGPCGVVALVALAALAGCPLKASGTATTTMTAGRSSNAGAASTTSASAGAGASAPSAGGRTAKATVPNLIGKTEEEARLLVKEAGFVHAPEGQTPLECVDAAREPDLINCQDPDPGTSLEIYQLIKIKVYRTQVIHGAIVRRQLESLRGLTPDQAKAQLKKMGHDGEVKIGVVTDYGGGQSYIKECGQNKVCYTSTESGTGIHDPITLFINPTLTIAPPPQ